MGCKSDTQNKIVRKKKAGNISGLLLCLLMRLILVKYRVCIFQVKRILFPLG